MPFLTPGTYAIQAALSGFTTVEQAGVTIRLGQTVDQTLTMQISSATSRRGRSEFGLRYEF